MLGIWFKKDVSCRSRCQNENLSMVYSSKTIGLVLYKMNRAMFNRQERANQEVGCSMHPRPDRPVRYVGNSNYQDTVCTKHSYL